MIFELVRQWQENKHKLEEYFKTTKQKKYETYKIIALKVFEICLPKAINNSGWNLNRITIIDHGDYSGTQIFIIPTNTPEPGVKDYVMTDTYYGSCSGCDTLQRIRDCDNDLPTDEQVKEYMTLALHLMQKIKKLAL